VKEADWDNQAGTLHDWRQRFQGLRYEASAGGMYQARTRELNSTLSTFVQQDMGYFGGANLYQAIGSQPTTSVDPFGLVPAIIVAATPQPFAPKDPPPLWETMPDNLIPQPAPPPPAPVAPVPAPAPPATQPANPPMNPLGPPITPMKPFMDWTKIRGFNEATDQKIDFVNSEAERARNSKGGGGH